MDDARLATLREEQATRKRNAEACDVLIEEFKGKQAEINEAYKQFAQVQERREKNEQLLTEYREKAKALQDCNRYPLSSMANF